jgi:5'-3' exonuclease
MIKSGSSFVTLGRRRSVRLAPTGSCSLGLCTEYLMSRNLHQRLHQNARGSCRIIFTSLAAMSWNDKSSGSTPPKFLTADDLDQAQRVYYSELSDFEDDVDGMAAKYNPEQYDFVPGEDMLDGREVERPAATDGFGASMVNQPIVADSLDSRPMKKRNETEMEITQEPLSPISFISIIADPNLPGEEDELQDEEDPTLVVESGNAPTDLSSGRSASTLLSSMTKFTSAAASNFGSEESSLSVDEFRAKFTFQPSETNIMADMAGGRKLQPSMPPEIEASKAKDALYFLEKEIKRLEKEITTANNGVPFNLGSYKQVSQALFGTPDQSVSKATLEGIAVSNILAKLILEHRQAKQRYNKLLQRKDTAQHNQEVRASQSAKATSGKNDNEPLILVDTSSFIFRAYYSMPPMHRSDGLPTSAVLGFCNMLNRMVLTPLLNGKQPRLVLCCDAPSPINGGSKTIRHELYDQYKANRQEAPMDLIPQFPLIRMAAQAYGMLWVEAPGYEADDVIASLSRQALEEGLSVHIYSGDKDLMQLVTNSSTTEGLIKMIDPMTMTHWEHDAVVEKWGVAAHQLGDVLALAGDSSDNIPGVPSIGPKIAAQLIRQFGSLERLLANLDQVPQPKRRQTLETYRDQAILSQQLVTLVRDLDWDAMTIDPLTDEHKFFPPPDRVGDLRMEPMNPDRMLSFYEAMGFVSIKERLIERLQRQSRIQYSYKSATTFTKNSRFGSKSKVQVPKPGDFDDVPF